MSTFLVFWTVFGLAMFYLFAGSIDDLIMKAGSTRKRVLSCLVFIAVLGPAFWVVSVIIFGRDVLWESLVWDLKHYRCEQLLWHQELQPGVATTLDDIQRHACYHPGDPLAVACGGIVGVFSSGRSAREALQPEYGSF